jgi:nucleoside-diphosphate-sugar epimerase
MREAVVLGGTGFIGRGLVRALLDSGQAVRVVSRSARPGRHNEPGLTYVPGDVGSADDMRRAVAGASVVYHLATGGGESWSDFERDFLQGLRNIAGACLDNGVERVVYTSSIAGLYLGGGGSIDERTGPDPSPQQRGNYARAKIEAEKIIQELAASRKLPAVILRPGLVVGKGGILTHSGVGFWASDTWCLGWGGGRHPLPFVLVEDVVSAMVSAGRAPGIDGMVFNLVGDQRPTAREFVRELGRRSYRRFHFYPQSLIKMQGIEIFKWLMKVAARKPGNTFPSYRDLKSRSLATQFDCSAAKTKLGWRPNANLEHFWAEAIDAHIRPVPPGDLRLAGHALQNI